MAFITQPKIYTYRYQDKKEKLEESLRKIFKEQLKKIHKIASEKHVVSHR